MIRKYKRTNPYSGQSEMLTNEEAILYDQVKMVAELGKAMAINICVFGTQY